MLGWFCQSQLLFSQPILVRGLETSMAYTPLPTGKLEVAMQRLRLRDLHNTDTGASTPAGFNTRGTAPRTLDVPELLFLLCWNPVRGSITISQTWDVFVKEFSFSKSVFSHQTISPKDFQTTSAVCIFLPQPKKSLESINPKNLRVDVTTESRSWKSEAE